MSTTPIYYIWYKFFSQKEFSPMRICSDSISVASLKEAIIEHIKNLYKSTSTAFDKIDVNKKKRLEKIDIRIFNADTKEEYTNDSSYFLSSYQRVLLERIPKQVSESCSRYEKNKFEHVENKAINTPDFEETKTPSGHSTPSNCEETLSSGSNKEQVNLTNTNLVGLSLFDVLFKTVRPSSSVLSCSILNVQNSSNNILIQNSSQPDLSMSKIKLPSKASTYLIPHQPNRFQRGRRSYQQIGFRERSRSNSRKNHQFVEFVETFSKDRQAP